MSSSLQSYLSTKKTITFRGKSYYKVKNYTHSYYIDKEIVLKLDKGTQDVDLEKNATASLKIKGLIKWDPVRKKILISESRSRVYFQPYDIV